MNLTTIKALDPAGNTFWWTGRAGSEWVSADPAQAFKGLTLEGARAKAARFNLNTGVHGLRFVAVVPSE